MTSRFLLLVVGLAVSLALTAGSAMGFSFRSFEYSINEAPPPSSPPGALGPVDTSAGSHPGSLTTSFRFNEGHDERGNAAPDGDVKDIQVDLPAGLVGDPNASPKCSMQQFTTPLSLEETSLLPEGSSLRLSGASCPIGSQVGAAEVHLANGNEAGTFTPVYNLVPPPGVPAEFGANLFDIPIVFTASVSAEGNDNVVVTLADISQALDIFASKVTFWGVPSDPSHNAFRGECLGDHGVPVGPVGGCPPPTAAKPFLTLPTSCPATPPVMTIRADPWQEPGVFITEAGANHDSLGNPVGVQGCSRLDFSPSMTIRPHTEAANSPTGMEVDLQVPQNESQSGLAESHLKGAVVTLPPGLVVNPSAADGREGCSPEEIALFSQSTPTCPNASKVGSVVASTPLLERPLEGAVYLAQQGNNPFHSLLAIYVVVEGDGVWVKLAGQVHADLATGRLTATFNRMPAWEGHPAIEGEPQLPFSDLKIDFFGGPRAALVTPACGTYAASASLAPWSGMPAVSPAIPAFEVKGGCGGGFAPSFTAGTVSNQAGGFSSFVTTISRGDQDQALGRVSVHTPPGLLGMLSKVSLCGEPQAAQGACSAASQIGHVTVSAGSGPDPLFVPQAGRREDPVFLTGPYKGAPFGLSILVHAEAGPFNLGDEVVRAQIDVDPHTGELTVVSDPLPTILQGIPLDVRSVTVTIDREGFIFNPTNCEPLAVSGTIASTRGVGASVSSRFQAADCASLGFKPSFKVSTQGHASKAGGASLDVEVGYPKGAQANIRRVVVALPKQLPARLTTLQKACPEATFAANPASCPAASNVGTAKAVTPVLNVPLVGPAYLVSHGGAAFPDLVTVLQGQGVRLDLVGNTNIRKSITTSTFAAVPDAPITSFELKLPQGPHSALTVNLPAKARYDLCGSKLLMPTTITGQNGAQIVQSTRIALTGCATAARAKTGRRRA